MISLIAASAIFLRGGEETYRLTAYFPRAIGLFQKSTVRVLGVEVGRVAAVAPEGDRVRVAMDVREGVKIPADASAIIVPISLISDRYVQFSPVWRGGATLRPGDEIPLERGVAPAELDDLLGTLKRFLQALEPGTPTAPGALGRFIQNADKALAGRGPQLGETIDTLSTHPRRRSGATSRASTPMIVNLDRLFGELALHDDALRTTNRGLATVMGSLANEEGALEAGTGNLASLVNELGSLVRAHKADLERGPLSILADVAEVLHRQKERRPREHHLAAGALEGRRAVRTTRVNKRVLVRDATPGIRP